MMMKQDTSHTTKIITPNSLVIKKGMNIVASIRLTKGNK